MRHLQTLPPIQHIELLLPLQIFVILLRIYLKAGLPNARILSTLREQDSSVTLVSKDISNLMARERAKQLGRKTPIQWLLEVYCLDNN